MFRNVQKLTRATRAKHNPTDIPASTSGILTRVGYSAEVKGRLAAVSAEAVRAGALVALVVADTRPTVQARVGHAVVHDAGAGRTVIALGTVTHVGRGARLGTRPAVLTRERLAQQVAPLLDTPIRGGRQR